jgi:sterol desaturase/sphingolipid hydroxylase (fatty acid hydroxylase superfamily)
MKEAIANAAAQIRQIYPSPAPESITRTLAGLVLGTLVLAALFYLLERLFPEQSGQPIFRKGTKVDFIYWFFDSLFTKRLATLSAASLVIVAIAFKMPRFSFASRQPLWLQAIETFLVADFCGYWSHRVMHVVPWLWRIHRVHHSSEQLDWLASARVHPLETVWTRTISILPLFLLGFSPKLTALLAGFIGLYPIFIHCNLSWGYGWVGYVVASPAFHRWHHSSDSDAIDKNFSGLLPLYDFVFGTAYFPKSGKPAAYGLAGERAPESFTRQLLWPFRA